MREITLQNHNDFVLASFPDPEMAPFFIFDKDSAIKLLTDTQKQKTFIKYMENAFKHKIDEIEYFSRYIQSRALFKFLANISFDDEAIFIFELPTGTTPNSPRIDLCVIDGTNIFMFELTMKNLLDGIVKKVLSVSNKKAEFIERVKSRQKDNSLFNVYTSVAVLYSEGDKEEVSNKFKALYDELFDLWSNRDDKQKVLQEIKHKNAAELSGVEDNRKISFALQKQAFILKQIDKMLSNIKPEDIKLPDFIVTNFADKKYYDLSIKAEVKKEPFIKFDNNFKKVKIKNTEPELTNKFMISSKVFDAIIDELNNSLNEK